MKTRHLSLLLLFAIVACAGPDRPQLGSMQTVSVRPGETIYQVASRLNVPARDMIAANHLSPPFNLAPGETLIVPVPGVYTVQRGDSLSNIASRFNISQSTIARLNHLSSPFRLTAGQRLELPDHHGLDLDTDALNAAAAQASNGAAVDVGPALTPRNVVEATPIAPPKLGMTDRSSPTALAPQMPVAVPVPASVEEAAPSGFLWPVRGDIVSTFGPKPGGLHNDGINIEANEGTPVKAAAAGTVAYAGDELKGFGNLVLIRHADGWVTAYAHLASLAVRKGDIVRAGQAIGTVGQTGSVDSPQLHFELRHGKDAVDPTSKLAS